MSQIEISEKIEITPKSDFYLALREKKTYLEKIDLLKEVTCSKRLAMLWLYLEDRVLPDREDAKQFTDAELGFLLRNMPNERLSSLSLTDSVYKDQRTVFEFWLTATGKPFTGPMFVSELNNPGQWSSPLLAIAFTALLDAWLQRK